MVDIWDASSHDDVVGTLGWFIVGVVISGTSFTVSHFFPRVLIQISTFRVALQILLHLGTVVMFMYPANKYLPFGMVRRGAGVPLILCGHIPIDILVEFSHPVHFLKHFHNRIIINNVKS